MPKRNKSQYDPFNPDKKGIRCPSCSAAVLACTEETVRVCKKCGRVERWLQPSREVQGDRRYTRLVSRQRKKFGDLDMILFQWVADPEVGEQ